MGKWITKFHLFTKTTALVVSILSSLTHCTNVSVPESYSNVSFLGLSAATLDSAGLSVTLTWNAPLDDSKTALTSGVEYQIYLSKYDSAPVDLSNFSFSGIQALSLSQDQQPRKSGKLIATVKNVTTYTVTASDAELINNSIYAFEVVAVAEGRNVDESSSVFFIKYQSSAASEYSLVPEEGNFQQGEVNSAAKAKFVAKLTKSDVPLAGEVVTFTILQGGGVLGASDVVTDTDGRAEVGYVAGPDEGTAKIRASWKDGYKEATFTMLLTKKADANDLAVASGNFQSGDVSTTFAAPIIFRATNGGIPVANQDITLAVTQGSGATLGTASGKTDASGLISTTFTAGAGKGMYIVTATWAAATKTANAVVTANLLSDGVTLEMVSGNSQSCVPSTACGNPLKVRLMRDGLPYASQTVAWTTAGGASVDAASTTTDTNGLAQINFTTGASSGTYEATASWSSGIRTILFSINAAPPSDGRTIEIADGNFQIDAVSSDFPTALKVLVKDGATPQVGVTVAWSIANAPAGAVGQAVTATSTTDASGYATMIFHAGDKAGTYDILASAFSGAKSVHFAAIGSTAAAQKILKIVQSGAGAQPEITTDSLDVASGTLAIKAALYDVSGTTYISDAPANWSAVGGGFNASDFSTSTTGQITVTFDPTRVGTTTISATYSGTDTSVIGTSDTTGNITVTSSLIPASMTIVAGDGQSAIVGNNLSTPLKVKLTNSSGVAVPGESINFTSVQGGGIVTSGMPVLTNVDGEATALVQVGTTAMANIFRATVVSDNTIKVDFNATALVGAATKILWSTQPAQAYQNFKFLTQPIVTIRDAYDNLVTSGSFNVTLEKVAGTGDFIGSSTLTRTSINGVATFTDVGWNTQENNVQIRAKDAAANLTAGLSSLFNVAAALSSACSTETVAFKTEDGGCKDQSTGVVWSGSYGAMTYHAAAWDAGVVGSSAPESSDNGRTNEYPESGGLCGINSASNCDNNSTSFCHDLSLGGYTDWRLPTFAEMQTARANGIASAQSAYGANWYWTRTPYAVGSIQVYKFSTGSAVDWYTPGTSVNVLCVRGGLSQALPTKLVWTTVPTSVVTGQAFTVVAGIVNASGNQVNREGENVTLSLVSGSGSITGTTTVQTNKEGKATFSLSYSGADETATFSATNATYGTTATNASIWFTSLVGGCNIADDAAFETAQGGCRDKSTGFVWSKLSSATMVWVDSIWDSSVVGSASPEGGDNGWTNEYASSTTSECGGMTCDSSTAAYCHDLVESGYSDWRLPDISQLTNARANGLGTRVNFGSNYVWSATANSTTTAQALRFSDGNVAGSFAVNYYVICVRGTSPPASPTKVEFVSTASFHCKKGTTCGNVIARIVDAGGNQVNKSGVSVTVSTVAGSGTLSGTLTKSTDRAGRVTFNDLSYDVSEPIQLALTNNAGLTNSTAYAKMNVTDFIGGCMIENSSWTSANGGCQHVSSGKVFSKVSSGAMIWAAAVWDSAYSTSEAADADDGARTNDYDGGQGSNTDNSISSYCHSLSEGGKTDWRLPSNTEMTIIGPDSPSDAIAGPSSNYPVTGNTYLWTSTHGGNSGCYSFKYAFNLFSNSSYVSATNTSAGAGGCANSSLYAICVRP